MEQKINNKDKQEFKIIMEKVLQEVKEKVFKNIDKGSISDNPIIEIIRCILDIEREIVAIESLQLITEQFKKHGGKIFDTNYEWPM